MSANNFLLIEKHFTRFRVFNVDADDCYKRKINDFDTLEEAIEAVNKYQKENEVEYGLQIDI